MKLNFIQILFIVLITSLNSNSIEIIRDDKEYKVTRLTDNNEALNSVLYFTNNGFTRGDKAIVYVKRIKPKWQLMYMDLASHEIFQLTHVDHISKLGGVVAWKTNEIFYSDAQDLHLFNIDTNEDKIIWKCPDNFSYSPISSLGDGSMVSFTIVQKFELKTKTKVLHSGDEELFSNKPDSIIMLGRFISNSWAWSEVIRIKGWVNHTQLNPIDGKTILYSCEGPQKMVEQRMWLVNSDGTNNHPLRKENNPAIHITHEFWLPDGNHIGFQNYLPGSRTIGIIDMTNNEKVMEYPLPVNNTHNFARYKNNGDLLVMGDGSSKMPFINFYTININKGTVSDSMQIAGHDSNISQEYWHMHARFSPTGRYMIYASANKYNGGDIYLIDNIPE